MKNLHTTVIVLLFSAFIFNAFSQNGILEVQGNGTIITNGDTTPELGDDTDFGIVAIGASNTNTFNLANIGSGGGADLNDVTVTITGSTAFTPLSINLGQIKKSNNLNHAITFTPIDTSLQTATVTITSSNSGTNVPFTFTITGQGSNPFRDIDVLGNGTSIASGDTTPSTTDDTDFGAIDVAAGTNLNTFTISNTGNLDLSYTSVSLTGTNAADFILSAVPAAQTITGGNSITFNITFNPSATGLRTALVTIVNDDPDAAESPYTFAISGDGVTVVTGSQNINVRGNAITIADGDTTPQVADNTDFLDSNVGFGITNTFEIQNTHSGGNPSTNVLNITSIVVSGGDAGDFTVNSTITNIARSASDTFTIEFNPTALGIRTTTVVITSNSSVSSEQTYTYVIQGEGTAPSPEIDIVDINNIAISDGSVDSPSTANSTSFGSTDTLNPLSNEYTIENNGAATLTISSITSSNPDFAISVAPSASIGSLNSSAFTITFTPTGTGIITSTITIINNDSAPEDVYTFTVQGEGTAAPPVYTAYYETFDSSDGGWSVVAATNDTWIRTNSFTTIDEMGEGYFWRNSAYDQYPINTNIIIESPVYDFSGLDNIRFSIDIKYNTENDRDGMRILYSVAGAPFAVLGASGQGTNWYQDNVTALGSDGWNDDGHSPNTAFSPHSQFGRSSIVLSDATFANQSNVRFRVEFSSDGSQNREGVAFDNVLIEADPSSTIGASSVAPANLTSNLRLWLKTNTGISNSDNTPLTLWEDQAYSDASLDKEDAFAETTIAPTYRDSGDRNINYNPVVDFDHNNIEYMNGKGGLFSQDYFIVFRSDDTVANQTGSFSPGREFAIGGRFADVSFHEDATGIAMGSSTARYDNEILAHNISSFPNGSQAPNTTSYGRAYSTTTDTYSNHPLIINVKSNASRTSSEIYKNGKRIDNVTGKAGNGVDLNFNEVNNLPFLIGTGRSGINGRTTSQMNGMITEVISYSSPNSATNQKKIQSYLAVKYGVTLQDNSSALLDHRLNDTDYIDSQGDIIWDTSDADIDGNFHNYDVAGIGRDDASNLDQRQSRSQNDEADVTGPTSGFLSMSLTETYDTNNQNIANTSGFQDREFLMWGNNNASLDAPAISITVDMSEDIGDPMLETNVSFESMSRIWKVVENRPTISNDIGIVEVSIPTSVVRTASPPDGRYLMFISQNGRFDPTADYRVMTENSGRLYVDYDFDGTEYITFGWAPERLFERSIKFDPSRLTYIDIEDNLDLDPASTDASDTDTDFTISAWINRNTLASDASIISKRNFGYTSGYDFKINTSGQLEFSWINGSKHTLNSSVNIPTGIWHHIAFIYKDGVGSIYIDGVLDVTQSMATPPINTSDSFLIGAAGKGVNVEAYFDGNIDEVRVWNIGLEEDQLRYLMNQELENNAGTIAKYFNDNSILPAKDEVSGIDYTKLEGYYPMSRYTYTNTKDESGRLRTGALKQLKTVDYQTAPLPYISTQNGDWTDTNTWTNGDKQYIPGSRALANTEAYVNWNVVETSHDIVINNATLVDIGDGDGNDNEGNRTVLAHIQNTGTVTVDGDNSLKTGYGYTVTHYLEMSGKFDLEGESQLIQTTNSDLILGPSGELEKDQQGTTNTYHYNYWSSPIGMSLTTLDASNTNPNRYEYSASDVMSENGSAIIFAGTGYDGSASPLTIADYWIWKFANNPDGDYSAWEHVRGTGTIGPGEGFTMKGPGTAGIEQNYTFLGKPNNADINLTISQGNDYLVGNPYASAIDARQFIIDNGPSLLFQGGTIQVSLDGAGDPVLDGNGNPIYIDNDGNQYTMQVDGAGDPVLDGNGNPIYEDSSGNSFYVQLDGNGDPVADSNGNPLYITNEVDATTSGTLYFWDHWGGGDHILSNYQGGYATYNLAGSTEAPFTVTGESDVDVSQVGTGVRAPGRYIPVGQGFFVVAGNGGTINFNNGQRIFKKESVTNGNTFRTTGKKTTRTTDTNLGNTNADVSDPRQKIKIGFNSVGGQHRQLLLTLDENTSPAVDWGYDGTTYDYKNDDMFWLIENNFYVIQASDSFGEEASYPLALYTSEDGNNSITIDQLINIGNDQDVFLHDIDLDVYHNLRESDYEIYLDSGYYDQRFEIVFSSLAATALGTDEDILDETKIDVRYSNSIDKVVLINPHALQVDDIQIYNIVGQHITEIKDIKNGNITEYNIGKLSSGPYIIKLNTVSGSVSKKVLIN